MDNFDLKKYLIENKVTVNSKILTEADEVDFKLTDISPDAKEIRTAMLSKGLKPTIKAGDYTHNEPSYDSYIMANQYGIEVGIQKQTNKAKDIMDFIQQSSFKDKYSIEPSQNADNWIIKMKNK